MEVSRGVERFPGIFQFIKQFTMQSDKITEMLLQRIVFLTNEYFKLKEEVERLKDMDKEKKPSKIIRMRIEK